MVMMMSRASQELFNKIDCALVSRLYNSDIQNALVSKRRTLLSCKIVKSFKYTASYA